MAKIPRLKIVAYIALAVFAIALTQYEIKDQLLGTSWGRAFTLILLIAAVKYNKWIGIVAALIVVFFFGFWDETALEGFKKKTKTIAKKIKRSVEEIDREIAWNEERIRRYQDERDNAQKKLDNNPQMSSKDKRLYKSKISGLDYNIKMTRNNVEKLIKEKE